MTSKDPLLQPFQLKHLTLKNRVLSTSHEPAYSEDGLPKLRYQLYQEEKAKGGMALTMFGGSTLIAPDSPPAFGNLYAGNDDIIPYFQELAARMHKYDAAVMCQITHLGRRTSPYHSDWLPTIWPSCVREPAHRAFPKVMEISDIQRVVKAYGAAALRCKQGDLDGVELEAYGHLLDSFWSTANNKRTDKYGGSLENRMRFSLEVIEEVRKQVGTDYIVGIRMVVDENMDGGLSFDEGMHIAKTLTDTGMLDFFNVIRGHVDTDEGLSHVIPNMGTASAPHLEFTASIKSELDLPVFHAARINDVATARYAVESNALDMVGMTRAHIADPHIVAKIERGEEHNIRPCVGAGYCIDRIYEANEALCIHNPATGREEFIPHVIDKASTTKKVVVIGAGPAGLEAARVCAERGHDVVLFEATDKPGGQIVLASKVERRREIIGIVDWRYAQCERLGVQCRFNTFAEADDVLAENPDVVIIATGGLPNTEFLREGADLVTTTWDILSGQVNPADNVLVYDDNGQHQGVSCAEHICDQVKTLEIVTPDRSIGQEIGGTNYPIYLKTFYENGVTMTVNHRLTSVVKENGKLTATFFNEFDKSRPTRSVGQVIVEHGTLAMDDLYFELKDQSINAGETKIDNLIQNKPQNLEQNPEGKFQLFRVGDAVASRNIHAAIYDSIRICKDL